MEGSVDLSSNMELLPDSLEDFQSKTFWDRFFKARNNRTFEWYCNFQALKPWFKNIAVEKAFLIPGCGNSDLSAEMYDAGFENITNVDFSTLVIREMLIKNLRRRQKMKWLVMDITQMKDGCFDVIFDKGALDALMGDSGSSENAVQYLKEMIRTLTSDGLFLCISLLQSHILRLLFQMLRHDFSITIDAIEIDAESDVSDIRPFVIKAQRLREYDIGYMPLITVDCSRENLSEKSVQIQDILNVKILQIVTEENKIRKIGVDSAHTVKDVDFDDIHPGQRIFIGDLECSKSRKLKKKVKFHATLLDSTETFDQICAVYIIPRGKNNAWLHASSEGQWIVSRRCQANRVILIGIHYVVDSPPFDQIKEALSKKLTMFLPKAVRHLPKATPILTSQTVDVPTVQRATYNSEVSGTIFIQDCIDDGQLLRRMIFGEGNSLIQTEAVLKPTVQEQLDSHLGKIPEDATSLKISFNDLAARYHQLIVSTLLQKEINEEHALKVLIIGLGGGILPMYLSQVLDTDIQVIELDPDVLKIAQQWFSFDPDIPVIIGDGIEYIQGMKTGDTDILVVDAGDSESSHGMSCPPEGFRTDAFYSSAFQLLSTDGMLIINFVSRSNEAFNNAVQTMKKNFPFLYSMNAVEDLNRVVIAMKNPMTKGHTFMAKTKVLKPNWDVKETLDSMVSIS